MGAGTDWICSLCKLWFKWAQDKPAKMKDGKWVCEKCAKGSG